MVNPIVDGDVAEILCQNIAFEKLQNSTVFISGANGMIASYLIYTLLALNDQRGYQVRVLAGCRNEAKAAAHFGALLHRNDLSLIVQDVCVPIQIDEPVDFIIHAASQASPKQFTDDPVGTLKVNTLGTHHMLELARAKQVQGFLYTSTREVYGHTSGGKAAVSETETGSLNSVDVRSCYPEGKRVSETMCACYAAQYGVPCTIVRIAHTYGYGMDLYDGRVIADLTKCAVLGQDIVLKSDGKKSFAITYIADMVSGILFAFLNGDELVYNIVNEDCVVSILQIAQCLMQARPDAGLQVRFEIPSTNQNTGYSRADFCNMDATRIRKLGWTPRYGAADGLNRCVQSFL